MRLCRVGYIGWNFHGTNVQPGEIRTVEGEMERILGGKVRFLSRTDTGVSAFNNYAICTSNTDPFSVNQLEDVWVTGHTTVNKRPRVFWRWYRYYYPEELEVPANLLKLFVGKRDFSSFSIPEKGRSTVREVLRFSSFTIPGFTVFDIVGKSFSRQMVRRVVMGIVLALKEGLDVEKLLRDPIPRFVPPAPPEGLVLMDMKIDVYVPTDQNARHTARKKLEKLWREYKLKSLVLSNRWIV